MFKHLAVICGLALTPAATQAESVITEFLTTLGPPDAYNSRGVPLNDVCTILQQDRANWHRFGHTDQFDGPDPFFTSTDRRAMIAGNCVYDRGYYANAGDRIRSGARYFHVFVRVYGNGGRVTRVVIQEGAG